MDSLELLSGHFSRLRDLAEQAANGTYGQTSLEAIQSEADARIAECVRLVNNTEYNNIKLFGTVEQEEDPKLQGAVKISECNGILEAGKKYCLDSQEELEVLQVYVNSGGDTIGSTFILTEDIIMSGDSFHGIGYNSSNCFKGTFDGNGHKIENLTIHKASSDNVGLFRYIDGAEIKNIGLINRDIEGRNQVGGLVGVNMNSTIQNCYVTGDVVGKRVVGGVVADNYGVIKKCYMQGSVSGNLLVGGVVGDNYTGAKIMNCYAISTVTGGGYTGGLAGRNTMNARVSNSVSSSEFNLNVIGGNEAYSNNVAALSQLDMQNPEIMANYGFNQENGWYYDGGTPKLISFKPKPKIVHIGGSNDIVFQVGIHGNTDSSIGLEFGLSMDLYLDFSSHEGALMSLENLDKYLNVIYDKQTEYGAAYNRMESALEEISTQIQNLSSTRSTIRDADIAKESSKYIQQQILQQASATLLATANQTPALALQLL